MYLAHVGNNKRRVDKAERGQLDGWPAEVTHVSEQRLRACGMQLPCQTGSKPHVMQPMMSHSCQIILVP